MLADFPESFERGVPHTLCRVLAPSLSHIPPPGFRAPWMPWPSELRNRYYRSTYANSQPAPSVQVENAPRASIYMPPTSLVSPPRKKAGRPRKSRRGALPGDLDSARRRLAPFVSPIASSRQTLMASTSPETPLLAVTNPQTVMRNAVPIPRLSSDLPRTMTGTRFSNTPATQSESSPVSSTSRRDYKQLAAHGDPHRDTLPSLSPAPTEQESSTLRRSLRKNHAAAATNNTLSSPEHPLESASTASTKRKNNDEEEPSRPSKRIRRPSAKSETQARTKLPAPSKMDKSTSDNDALCATRPRARKRTNSDEPVRVPKKRKP